MRKQRTDWWPTGGERIHGECGGPLDESAFAAIRARLVAPDLSDNELGSPVGPRSGPNLGRCEKTDPVMKEVPQ